VGRDGNGLLPGTAAAAGTAATAPAPGGGGPAYPRSAEDAGRPPRPVAAVPAEAGERPGREERALLEFVAPRLARALEALLPARAEERWRELRLRLGRPVQVVTVGGERWLGHGGPAAEPSAAPPCEREDLERTIQLVTRASVYAWEDELARGFCTIPGGHRIGLGGTAVARGGTVGQKAFGSLVARVPPTGCWPSRGSSAGPAGSWSSGLPAAARPRSSATSRGS
jgi:hypothetical protein